MLITGVNIDPCASVTNVFLQDCPSEFVHKFALLQELWYVVGSKIFRPDIKKPRQMENAVRDI